MASPENTIHQIKAKIKHLTGFPEEQQVLFDRASSESDPLDNEMRLVKLGKNCTLDLFCEAELYDSAGHLIVID